MRKHTNFCAPVNKLPVEVLRMIFSMCTFAAPALGDRQGNGVGHPSLIISHTCSYWRAVSLDFPALWSRVRLAGLPADFQAAIMDRAQNCPLDVWLDLSSPLPESLSKMNMGIVFRAKTLHIRVPAQSNDTLAAFFAAPPAFVFSHLEILSLQLFQEGSTSHVQLVLQHPLFAGYTPRLRHLYLEGIRMPWCRGFYYNLTRLKLTSCENGTHAPQDHDICAILQDSPNLEDLELSLYRSQFPISDPIPSQPHERILLPFLRSLKANCGLGYIRHLLSSIDARSLYTMDIRIRDLYPDQFEAVLSEGRLLPPQISSAFTKVRVEISARELEIKFAGQTAEGCTNYVLTWCYVYHPALGELCSFLQHKHLPLKELEIVSDAHENEAPPSIWTEQPGSFAACLRISSLESLSLVGDITPLLLPQMLLDGNLIARASAWPHLAWLSVRAKLDNDATQTLARWCWQRPALRSLDLSGSVIHVAATAHIPSVVSMFQSRGFAVTWTECQFYDNSAHHMFRHPEVLWPHLFRTTRPRQKSPLQHVLSAQ